MELFSESVEYKQLDQVLKSRFRSKRNRLRKSGMSEIEAEAEARRHILSAGYAVGFDEKPVVSLVPDQIESDREVVQETSKEKVIPNLPLADFPASVEDTGKGSMKPASVFLSLPFFLVSVVCCLILGHQTAVSLGGEWLDFVKAGVIEAGLIFFWNVGKTKSFRGLFLRTCGVVGIILSIGILHKGVSTDFAQESGAIEEKNRLLESRQVLLNELNSMPIDWITKRSQVRERLEKYDRSLDKLGAKHVAIGDRSQAIFLALMLLQCFLVILNISSFHAGIDRLRPFFQSYT